MAAEALPVVEPMTASVHVEEMKVPKFTVAKTFLRTHQNTIILAAVGIGALWVNRVLIRRDLKHINFTAEFYPDWMFDGDGEFVGIGE